MPVKLAYPYGDPCGDGTILYLHYINVSINVVILYYNSAGWYHWAKLHKGDIGNLSVIFYNWMFHSNWWSDQYNLPPYFHELFHFTFLFLLYSFTVSTEHSQTSSMCEIMIILNLGMKLQKLLIFHKELKDAIPSPCERDAWGPKCNFHKSKHLTKLRQFCELNTKSDFLCLLGENAILKE